MSWVLSFSGLSEGSIDNFFDLVYQQVIKWLVWIDLHTWNLHQSYEGNWQSLLIPAVWYELRVINYVLIKIAPYCLSHALFLFSYIDLFFFHLSDFVV